MGSIYLRTFTQRIAVSRNRHTNHFTSESTSGLKRERESRRREVKSESLYMERKSSGTHGSTVRSPVAIASHRSSKLPTWCSRVLKLCLKKLLWLEWHSYIYLRRHSSLFPLASFSDQFSHRVHTGFHSLEGSKVTLEFPLPSFHSFFAVSNFP